MRITDLIDVSILRELNCSLVAALGMAMALTDSDGRTITASAGWSDDEDGCPGECETVPVRVGGRDIATWHLKPPCCGVRDVRTHEGTLSGEHVAGAHVRTACSLLERPQTVEHSSLMLVTLVARMMTGYASANLALLERVREHAAAALDAMSSSIAMQRVIDSCPVGLVELDRNGGVVWSNRRAHAVLDMGEFETRGIAGPAAPWTVDSINGVPYERAWVGIARRLVRGETVTGLLCRLSRLRGRTMTVRIDVSPRLSGDGRISRLLCAVCDDTESQSRRVPDVDGQLDKAIEPLTHAWLEIDAVRQSLSGDDMEAAGRLDIAAALLRETVANVLAVSSGIRLDYQTR